MTLILQDEIEIRVGKEPREALRKLANVQEVLSEEKRSQIIYIDLRYKDIVVKKK
jgi:cell division septal protein FtsQ